MSVFFHLQVHLVVRKNSAKYLSACGVVIHHNIDTFTFFVNKPLESIFIVRILKCALQSNRGKFFQLITRDKNKTRWDEPRHIHRLIKYFIHLFIRFVLLRSVSWTQSQLFLFSLFFCFSFIFYSRRRVYSNEWSPLPFSFNLLRGHYITWLLITLIDGKKGAENIIWGDCGY